MALTLSRKVGEKIFIDSNIIITIQRTRGEEVRLSIEAPKNVRIARTAEFLQKALDEVARACQDKHSLNGCPVTGPRCEGGPHSGSTHNHPAS